jgi:hypothetical protein
MNIYIKNMVGREKIDEILSLMEAGESERAACKAGGISRSTFRSAVLREKVADHYARALEGLALDQVEKLEAAIDDMRSGVIDYQVARVEIDARKWFASKLLPKRFGEKLDMTTDGEKITIPIYGGQSLIQKHDSNQEDIQPKPELGRCRRD